MVKHHILSLFCFTVILTTILPSATPPAGALSEKWTKTFSYASGTSMYTLLLDSPDVVPSDSNWTITTSLIVDYMDKYKDFLFFSTIEVAVETSNGKLLKKKLQFGLYPISEFPERLYPGGRWGPNKVTFNLAEEDLGLIPGQSVDATLYITVNLSEFVKQLRIEQQPYMTYEIFSLVGGKVKIVNTSSPLLDYIPYILGVAVGLTVFATPLLRERFSSKAKAYGE